MQDRAHEPIAGPAAGSTDDNSRSGSSWSAERHGRRPLENEGARNPADLVEQPAKVMRIGTMVKQLLEEVRTAPLDDAARSRLAEVHERSLRELEDGLAPDLVGSSKRITLPFSDEGQPSDAELRIAQAQLVGWLEGLFHGLQTALVAQQMYTAAATDHAPRASARHTGHDGGPVRAWFPVCRAVAPDGGQPGSTSRSSWA